MHAQIPQFDGGAEPETNENISYDSDDSDRGININTKKNCARMLITNARSLLPKVGSMVDAFQSLDLHFACLTETWFRGGRQLADQLDELEDRKGIKIIHKSRDGRRKRSGGGVAIAFDTSTCNLKRRQMANLPSTAESFVPSAGWPRSKEW